MNARTHSWYDYLEGVQGIRRHFDVVHDLEPLLLTALNYDSRSLDLEFVSFALPQRFSPRWPKGPHGGTRLRIIGSTYSFSIRQPAYSFNTSFEVSECRMDGVAYRDGELIEREFAGVLLKLIQDKQPVVTAACCSLRLAGISPLDLQQADCYRNPERYL